MNGIAAPAPFRLNIGAIPAFHRQMAFACAAILALSMAGGSMTSIRMEDIFGVLLALTVLIAAVLLLPIYWHEKGKLELRDAALTIPWCMLLSTLLPYPVAVAARLGMGFPLRDELLMHMDQSLGMSVPAIIAWASHHWLGRAANWTYPLLIAMIPLSFLLPALTGKAKLAQQFLTSNLIAFAIGLSIFALLPAVGPWWGYHFTPSAGQAECQQSLFLMRDPSSHQFHPEGVVCFPSFHVFWAILCGRTLWCFWPLRIPASLLSGLIILSTMTTGWHYFVDVLAGCMLALVSIAAAKALPA